MPLPTLFNEGFDQVLCWRGQCTHTTAQPTFPHSTWKRSLWLSKLELGKPKDLHSTLEPIPVIFVCQSLQQQVGAQHSCSVQPCGQPALQEFGGPSKAPISNSGNTLIWWKLFRWSWTPKLPIRFQERWPACNCMVFNGHFKPSHLIRYIDS